MKVIRFTGIILMVLGLLLLLSKFGGCGGCSSKQQTKTQPSAQHQSSPNREKTLKTFTFQNGAGITMYLEPGWEIYAIGGNIKIVTPTGNEIDDEPGSTTKVGMQPRGYYTIYPTEKNTQQVQVKNYWNTATGF